MKPLSAAIVAGGKASRMNGINKAEIVIGGKRLIDRYYSTLQGWFDDILLISGFSDGYQGVWHYSDIYHGIGPLGGIHSALTHAQKNHVFVVSIDMPFLNSEVIQWLLETPELEQYDVIIPTHGNRLEPLHAIYSKSCSPYIEQQIVNQQYAIRTFFPWVKVLYRELPPQFDAETVFFNINYPEDILKANQYANRMEHNPR